MNANIKRRRSHNLDLNDRRLIQRLIEKGKSREEIAVAVGCSYRHIFREIQRAETPYNAEREQAAADKRVLEGARKGAEKRKNDREKNGI